MLIKKQGAKDRKNENVPVIINKIHKFFLIQPFISLILILFFGLFFYYDSLNQSFLSSFYESIKLHSTEGIKIENIKVVKRVRNNKLDVLLTGDIVNDSDIPKKIPAMKISFLTKTGEALAVLKSQDVDSHYIDPKTNRSFYKKLVQLPRSSKILEVELGNYLELLIR